MADTGSTTTPTETKVQPICSFWGRLLALGVDLGLLFMVGSLLGMLFEDRLAQLGVWGRLVGFALVVFYFGLLNSRMGQGQTLGKRLLRVRVVDAKGELISLGRSLLRAVILGAIFLLDSSMAGGNWVVYGIVLALWLGLIYWYVFNRGTRQSLHDLVVGTYVVRDEAAGPVSLGRPGRLHFVGFSILIAIGIGCHIGLYLYSPISDLIMVQKKLNQVEGVRGAVVQTGTSYGGSTGEHTYLTATVLLDGISETVERKARETIAAAEDSTALHLPPSLPFAGPSADLPLLTAYIALVTSQLSPPSLAYFQAVAQKVDRVLVESYPGSASIDKRVIQVQYGYEIGIAPRAFVQVERSWGLFHGVWREEVGAGVDYF